MPTGYRKKPLGAWPDDKKHQEVRTPQEEGEESISGHMPNPEEINNQQDEDQPKDTLDRAREAGEYHRYDDDYQGELGLGEQENEDLAEEDENPASD
jgi:hypothetical protein